MIRNMDAALVVTALLLAGGLVAAQDVQKESQSKKVVSVSVSKDGVTRSYKRVIENGKVIEESGDPSLLGEVDVRIDLDDLLSRAKRSADADTKAKTRTRRLVIRDGKKVVDEEAGDLDWEELDLPAEVEDVLRRIGGGKGKPGLRIFRHDSKAHGTKDEDRDVDVDVDVDMHGLEESIRRAFEGAELRMPEIERALKDVEIQIPKIEHSLKDMEIRIPRIEAIELSEPERRIESKVDITRSKSGIATQDPDLSELKSGISQLRKEIRKLQDEIDRLSRKEDGGR